MKNQMEIIFEEMNNGDNRYGYTVKEIREFILLRVGTPFYKKISTADSCGWYSNYLSTVLRNLCLKAKNPKFRRRKLDNGYYVYYRN